MDVEILQNRVNKAAPHLRRRRKRSVWRKTVLPLIKLCTLGALVCIVACTAVSRISRPVKLLSSEYRETRQLGNQLAQLKQENAVLERRIKHLKSPRGAEQVARKLGYVKPGEITLVIPE